MSKSAKSPVASVKESFGEKSKLVSELENFTKDEDLWIGRTNTSKGLAHVSNAKLLKLHATFTAVKDKFGTRAKLIDAIAEVEKRAKDEGYKTRLAGFPVPRLWDMYKSASKRTAAKTAAPKAKKTAAVAAPKTEKAAPKTSAAAAKKPANKKK